MLLACHFALSSVSLSKVVEPVTRVSPIYQPSKEKPSFVATGSDVMVAPESMLLLTVSQAPPSAS